MFFAVSCLRIELDPASIPRHVAVAERKYLADTRPDARIISEMRWGTRK